MQSKLTHNFQKNLFLIRGTIKCHYRLISAIRSNCALVLSKLNFFICTPALHHFHFMQLILILFLFVGHHYRVVLFVPETRIN